MTHPLFDTPTALPVSELLAATRLLLERQMGEVWVSGELSDVVRAASGHFYFTLKDEKAQVRCTLWRHRAQMLRLPPETLRNGQHVELRATPTLYEARGDFQLNVTSIRRAGQGALYERFLRLKARFEAEGLFATERKRPLSVVAHGIALVTSPSGAALRDILITLKRRWPTLPVVLYPTLVQGEGAAGQIAAAIGLANQRREQDGTDVLIVARGGGALEDLMAFNEEPVVRAIAASVLPVVSGVGHETDTTLCDFVADVRAATPTAAAMLVSPDGAARRQHLEQNRGRLQRAVQAVFARAAQRLDEGSLRLAHPRARLAAQQALLVARHDRLVRAWQSLTQTHRQTLLLCQQQWQHASERLLSRHDRRLGSLTERLQLLNPQNILERGYAIVATPEGQIVSDARTLAPNDPLRVTLAHGEAGVVVRETAKEAPNRPHIGE